MIVIELHHSITINNYKSIIVIFKFKYWFINFNYSWWKNDRNRITLNNYKSIIVIFKFWYWWIDFNECDQNWVKSSSEHEIEQQHKKIRLFNEILQVCALSIGKWNILPSLPLARLPANSIQFNSIQFNSIQFNSIQFYRHLFKLYSDG